MASIVEMTNTIPFFKNSDYFLFTTEGETFELSIRDFSTSLRAVMSTWAFVA